MPIKIKSFIVGPIDVNCYIVSDDTNEGVIVDAGGGAKEILDYVAKEHINVKALLNTHGHGDHIGANDEIRDALNVPLYIHALDNPMLTDPRKNLSAYMGFMAVARPAENLVGEGDKITFGHTTLNVLHTPGHSPGGVCYVDEADGLAFVGDTLFQGSIGRTDFPGGSEVTLVRGIKDKLMKLDDDVRVLTGHGPMTTIGYERRFNMFLQW